MSYLEKKVLEEIQFYVTTKYACGYINGQDAQSIVATPYKKINSKNFNNLINKGFRRSGQYVYKPNCKNCSACIPIRLLAKDFTPSKSQKRVRKVKHLLRHLLRQRTVKTLDLEMLVKVELGIWNDTRSSAKPWFATFGKSGKVYYASLEEARQARAEAAEAAEAASRFQQALEGARAAREEANKPRLTTAQRKRHEALNPWEKLGMSHLEYLETQPMPSFVAAPLKEVDVLMKSEWGGEGWATIIQNNFIVRDLLILVTENFTVGKKKAMEV